ncbi:acyl-CoA thioesterase [Croceicoccus hydrothermalis]|uniref:acyl-CoA thioesterase n=1 Tax=Croceicoccus hydrothermalis TaxID=2867964 RepID=UPI001EFBC896|nr:acyl-CoA thioesterase domain-containing protein [Croceicoccus hydrothermalis]
MDLIEILRVSRGEDGVVTGRPGQSLAPRVFGGHIVAQAMLAAAMSDGGQPTRDGRAIHSVHAHFLRAGDLGEPITYAVSNLSTGRSFATRQVTARQSSGAIFTAIVSFHAAEHGPAHAAPPRAHAGLEQARRRLSAWIAGDTGDAARWVSRLTERPIELVPLDPDATFGNVRAAPRGGWWMRLRKRGDHSPVMQRALLAYASDLMFLRTALLPHGVRAGSGAFQLASLDHTIWFHDTPDMNDWLVFLTDSPWAGHARGLNQGHIFDASGRMIATVMQESLMRPRGPNDARMAEESTR